MAGKLNSRKINGAIKALNRTQRSGKKKVKSKISLSVDLISSKDLDKLRKEVPGAIEAAHLKTLNYIADELEIALGLAMESKNWQWDYGDGDIVDTGQLRDSVELGVTANGISISYGAEYAAVVYYGGYIHPYGNPNVQIYMPGRPWVNAVLNGGFGIEKFDFESIYLKQFNIYIAQDLKSAGVV